MGGGRNGRFWGAPILAQNPGLECRKWGFKRWRFKQIRRYMRKNGLFPPFSGFPGVVRALRKRAKRQENGKKGRYWPISRTGGQAPLKPPFITPPFAALHLDNAAFFTKIEKSHRVKTPRVKTSENFAEEKNVRRRYFRRFLRR